eukprot:638768-Pleurochrysis_carterae.AAC.1
MSSLALKTRCTPWLFARDACPRQCRIICLPRYCVGLTARAYSGSGIASGTKAGALSWQGVGIGVRPYLYSPTGQNAWIFTTFASS